MSNEAGDTPTFRSAAEAAELALSRLRDAVGYQGDPMVDAGASYMAKSLESVAKEMSEMSEALDDEE